MRVSVGSDCFIQAERCDDELLVQLGCGFVLPCALDDAPPLLRDRIALCDARVAAAEKRVDEVKSRINSLLLGIRGLEMMAAQMQASE